MATKRGRPKKKGKPRIPRIDMDKVEEGTFNITAPIVEMSRWHKVDLDNPAAVEARIDEFFDFCIENNLRPSVELLVAALKISRTTLNNWCNRPGWKGEMFSQAKATINAILSEMALNNMVNPTTVIWFQKNHEGYQDSVNMESRQNTGLDLLPSREDILRRLPVGDDDEEIEDAEYKEIAEDEQLDEEIEGLLDDGEEG